MKKAARHGRGSYTFIADPGEVEEKMQALFSKLEMPALVDIHAGLQGLQVQAFPDPVPDLYAGEPLTVFLQASRLGDRIELAGRYGDSEWRTSVALNNGIGHEGVSVAWAREKIASLMDRQREAETEVQRERIRSSVVETALQHHLVSRYTSMVAVDVTPANSSGLLVKEKMKTALPHGWRQVQTPPVMFAQLGIAQTATGWQWQLVLACLMFSLAWILRKAGRSG
jgi:Ca-activated chloride channel family protein